MSGSKAAAKAANTAKAESSPGLSSQADPEKETAQEANTANDRRAYREIMRHSADNLRETGVEVRVWQSDNNGVPVVLFAVYVSRLCGICGNVYPANEICGICAEGTKP